MRLLCAVLVSVLLVAGCSGGETEADPGPDTSSEGTEETPRDLDADELEDVLLTVDDLSDGFDGGAVEVGGETEDTDVVIEQASEECETVRRSISVRSLLDQPRAEAEFARSGLGPFVGQAVVLADEDAIQDVFDDLSDADERCPSFTLEHADGTRTAFELHPSTLPQLGDRSITIEMGMTMSDGTNHLFGASTTVLVQLGPHLLILAGTHFADQPQFAEGEMVQLVRTAIDRIEEARA